MFARLTGTTVLVLEDNSLICLELAEALGEAGARVLTATTVPDALAASADPALLAAVLDVKLWDETCEPVCERLAARRVPFIFFTGYDRTELTQKWPRAHVVPKPSSATTIIEAVYALV